jgi:hypothetical protein
VAHLYRSAKTDTMIPTNIKYVLLFLLLVLSCFAKDASIAGRVRLDYDETRWQRRPVAVPGADVLQLANDEGTFTVLVMPEKLVAGGMSSAESRRKYFEQLAKTNVKTEDVISTEVAGKNGFEFRGKRAVSEIEYRMRILLIVDAGDVLILMSSAPGKNPMDVPSIAAIWKSISIPQDIPR